MHARHARLLSEVKFLLCVLSALGVLATFLLSLPR